MASHLMVISGLIVFLFKVFFRKLYEIGDTLVHPLQVGLLSCRLEAFQYAYFPIVVPHYPTLFMALLKVTLKPNAGRLRVPE